MTIKVLCRLKETAWSGHHKILKLKRKPRLKELEANFEGLTKAIDSVIAWYEDGNNHNDYYKACKLLVSLFGFDPYEGNLYRSIPVLKKVNKIPIEGKRLRLKATVSKLSSWTTSLSNAARFGEESNKPYVVIQAKEQVLQVMNTSYLRSIVQYLLSIPQFKSRIDSLSDLEDRLETYKREDEVTVLVKPRMLVEVVLVYSKNLPFVRRV